MVVGSQLYHEDTKSTMFVCLGVEEAEGILDRQNCKKKNGAFFPIKELSITQRHVFRMRKQEFRGDRGLFILSRG